MRTHKQDTPLLFADRLHAEVEVADTVTTFLCSVVFISPSLGQLYKLEPLRARTTERHPEIEMLLLYRHWSSEGMGFPLMMLSSYMPIYHGSCLNRIEVSHSPWMPDGMRNSKLYPASKHRGEKGDEMS